MTKEEKIRCMNEYIKAEAAKITELQNIKIAIYSVGTIIFFGLMLVACSV